MNETRNSLGTFHWHNLAQFGGALNDNLFKFAVIFGLSAAWADWASSEQVLAIANVVFAVPFLLFLGLGGVLADRFRKTTVVRTMKMLEIAVMSLGAIALFSGQGWLMLIAMFTMSTQSSLFGPSKFGAIPELVGRENISRANGQMQAATYLAIIAGTALAPYVSVFFNKQYGYMGLVSIGIAVLGWLASLRIAPSDDPKGQAKASVFFLKDIYHSLKIVHKDGWLALAVWSGAYFLMVAAFVQLNLFTYGVEHLDSISDKEGATKLFLSVAFGIGTGSFLAGRFSRRNIEFGLIPVGSFMMALCGVLLWRVPHHATWMAHLACLGMGLGAGFFILPIQAFIQYRSPPEKVGEIVAASSWLTWVGALLASALIYLTSSVLKLSAAEGFLFLSVLVMILAIASLSLLPDFFARLWVMIITRLFYRLQVSGLDNLPAQGGALLVCNHVSLMDAVWLTASQQRRIRFVMSKRFIEESCSPMLRRLLKLGGVIPIHEGDNPKAILKSLQEAREVMQEGYIVGIFPEGHLTRTGHLLPFKAGFERIARGSGCPIVPCYIHNGFGAHASHAYGAKASILDRRDFRRPVRVMIGKTLPEKSNAATIRNAILDLAADASEAEAPRQGSAALSFVRCAKQNWKRPGISDSSGKDLSFGEALIATQLLKGRLRKALGKEQRIGLLLPPSVGGALVNLGLALDRRVSVNLNYTASPAALQSAMDQAGVRTLITSKLFLEKFPETPLPEQVLYAEDLAADFSTLQKLGMLIKCKLLSPEWLHRDTGWKPEDELTVLFSSGSTAEPKGIPLNHLNVLSNIDGFSTIACPRENDCLCSVLPFFHSFGFTVCLWFPLTRGVPVTYHHHPLETDAISRIARDHKATILVGTPTFLMAWVRKIDPDAFAQLRWAVVGAEKLRPRLADMFEKRYGIRPLEGYGATECSPVISVNVPDVDFGEIAQKGMMEGSVGRPLPNLRIRVVSPETGEELPQGEEGLLLVKGPSVMSQYLDNPDKTAEVLQDGWYNTGDIVKLDADGFITITDRLSRFSKLAGEMISHSAVEQALQEALGIQPNQLAVTGARDAKKGEKLIVVYTQELGDSAAFQEKIREAPIPNLWKPDPRNWMPVEALPVLGTGKVDLKGLKQLAETMAD